MRERSSIMANLADLESREAADLSPPKIFSDALSSAKSTSDTQTLQLFRQELPDPHIELFTRDYLIRTFTQFERLPTELRLKIWNLIPRERTVVVCADKYNCLRSLTPSPVTFYVNHESRRETQKHYSVPYTLANYPPTTPQPALHQHHFDPDVDTVHVTAEHFNLEGDFMFLLYPEPPGQGPHNNPETSEYANRNLVFDGDDEPRQEIVNGETLSIIRYLEIEMDVCRPLFGTKHGTFEFEHDDEGTIEFFDEIVGLRRVTFIRDWGGITWRGLSVNLEVAEIDMSQRPFTRCRIYHQVGVDFELKQVRKYLGKESYVVWESPHSPTPSGGEVFRLSRDGRR